MLKLWQDKGGACLGTQCSYCNALAKQYKIRYVQ